MVHNILKQMAVKLGNDCTLLSLYEKFGWELYEKYGHAFDAFRLIMRYDQCQLSKSVQSIVTRRWCSRRSKFLNMNSKYSMKVLPGRWLRPP